MIAQALYAAFGGVLVASALLVILQRNPVTSALFLVSAFCALAGIYLTLHAEFLGMVQIIVYAGAIMVLFLFVIMYLNLKHDVDGGVQIAVRRGLGWIVGAVLVSEAGMFVSRGIAVGPRTPDALVPVAGNTQAIGQILYTRYLFPFEITSLVLLVAMVGAIMISRPRYAPPVVRGLGAPASGASPTATPAPVSTPATASAHTPEGRA